MIALLQRVSAAKVEINGAELSRIARGILVLLAVEKGDTQVKARRLAERVCTYRIFNDAEGKMNLSVKQIGGQLLIVSQFTLAANTQKGTRASFSAAADPQLAAQLYAQFCGYCRALGLAVAEGSFGASMQVSLCNDGPVSFWLQL